MYVYIVSQVESDNFESEFFSKFYLLYIRFQEAGQRIGETFDKNLTD